MATIDAEDIFECPVCFTCMLDKKPRLLPCVHTCCEICLKGLVQYGTLTCPKCRRIIEVPDNQVERFPINFMLHQMKDALERKERKTPTQCQMCKKSPPVFKCEECCKILCETCKESHSEIRLFENHDVFVLCLKHQDSVTQLCLACNTPLCNTCIVLDHKHHAEFFQDFDVAYLQLKEESVSMKEDVNKAEEKLEEYVQVASEASKENDLVEKGLLERREGLWRILDEIEETIKVTDKNKKIFKKIEKDYQKAKDQSNQCKQNLDVCVTNESKFHIIFPEVKKEAENTKKMIQKVIKTKYKVPSLDELSDFTSKQMGIKGLKKSTELLSITKSGGVGYSKQIVSLGNDILTITEERPSHVIRINQKGEVKDHYYPEVRGEVDKVGDLDYEDKIRDVAMYEDNVYILHDYLTVMSSDKQQKQVYKPKIKVMYKMLVLDENIVLISDYQSSGHVYSFNVTTNRTKSMVKDLEYPSYLSMAKTEKGIRFIVTEDYSNCVSVYSESWKLLHIIGKTGLLGSDGRLNGPLGTAITNQNTILIADRNNDRICHFTLEGNFLSEVLAMEDVMMYPAGLLYKNNVLWVCGWNSGGIKCFQLQHI